MALEGIPYANEEAVSLAQSFEERVRALPPSAGVIFVGVRVEPVLGGKAKAFHITLGIDRSFEETTGEAILKKVFEKEIEDGQVVLTAKVFRGICGAANYAPPARPRKL